MLNRLLKSYLSMLPDPLFGNHLYRTWLQFNSLDDPKKIPFVKDTFRLLDADSLATAQYLLKFFVTYASVADPQITLRHFRQLASNYGASLIRSISEDSFLQTLQIPIINKLLEFILVNFLIIFPDKK